LRVRITKGAKGMGAPREGKKKSPLLQFFEFYDNSLQNLENKVSIEEYFCDL